MKAMLLAAGRGTRLGALGQSLPKPLLPICGYPAITFGLAACARAGVKDVIINLHHHAEMIRRAVADGSAWGTSVTYSPEVDLLGTGGGLAQARPLYGDQPLLVMNAKVVADLDIAALLAAHQASGADATLVLRDDPAARTWGAIAADESGEVVGILDARGPRPPRGAVVERMFTGIQVVGAAVLDRLRPVFSDSIREGYIPALREGADIRAFVLPTYFAEHSTPERYLEGNLALLRHPAWISHPPGPLTGIHPTAVIAPDARIVEPVRIDAHAIVESQAVVGPEVAVGAGARVRAGAQVSHTVLWPGAVATGSHHHAILTPQQTG